MTNAKELRTAAHALNIDLSSFDLRKKADKETLAGLIAEAQKKPTLAEITEKAQAMGITVNLKFSNTDAENVEYVQEQIDEYERGYHGDPEVEARAKAWMEDEPAEEVIEELPQGKVSPTPMPGKIDDSELKKWADDLGLEPSTVEQVRGEGYSLKVKNGVYSVKSADVEVFTGEHLELRAWWKSEKLRKAEGLEAIAEEDFSFECTGGMCLAVLPELDEDYIAVTVARGFQANTPRVSAKLQRRANRFRELLAA